MIYGPWSVGLGPLSLPRDLRRLEVGQTESDHEHGVSSFFLYGLSPFFRRFVAHVTETVSVQWPLSHGCPSTFVFHYAFNEHPFVH